MFPLKELEVELFREEEEVQPLKEGEIVIRHIEIHFYSTRCIHAYNFKPFISKTK